MRVLVVGSGAREHALAWRLSRSSLVDALFAAPGNPGIAEIARCAAIAIDNIEGLVALAQSEKIDFVVVGPELPLTLGLVDRLDEICIPAFGPCAAAARLEGSKGFTKALCAERGIPTAAFGNFEDKAAARDFLKRQNFPIVIKADGLAAGKGVVIAVDRAEAEAALEHLLSPGSPVVIEEFLAGEEVSFFALCDGKTAMPLASAQDHKRVGDGDTGLNTGGMGAYSPAPLMSSALEAQVMTRIIHPTLEAMAERGTPFKGVLYAGLMVDKDGIARLIEYNVRFGDPEAQVLMMRLESDLAALLLATAQGRLKDVIPKWHDAPALTVVMATKGYPGPVEAGSAIGLPDLLPDNVRIFQAATKRASDGGLTAAGGRVLSVTACAATVAEAQKAAYQTVDRIDWPEGFCRRDIGWRAI